MKYRAYAKINLGLDVLRKRQDGYHEVRMIMQNIGVCDVLEFEKVQESGIQIDINNSDLPVNEDNLIYKAAKLIMDKYDIKEGLKVSLTKNIPVAAGLAGGSTDAAATLKAVNDLWTLGLTGEELRNLGVKIGADVPYCIMGGTAISEGIGEILSPICDCPKCYVLIAKPPVGVSTKYVYEHLKINELVHPDIDAIIEAIEHDNICAVADNLGNVLESVTIGEYPVIEDIKNIMKENGALNALMSGSGPTVFGLFDNKEKMSDAAKAVRASSLAKDIVETELVSRE